MVYSRVPSFLATLLSAMALEAGFMFGQDNRSVDGQSQQKLAAEEKQLEGFWAKHSTLDTRDYLLLLPDGKAEKGKIRRAIGEIGLKTYEIETTRSESGTWKLQGKTLKLTFGDTDEVYDYRLNKQLFLDNDLYFRIRVDEIRKQLREEQSRLDAIRKSSRRHPNLDRVVGVWTRKYGVIEGARINILYNFESDGTYWQVSTVSEGGETEYRNLVEARWVMDDRDIFVLFPKYNNLMPYRFEGDKLQFRFAGSKEDEYETMKKGSDALRGRIQELIRQNRIERYEWKRQ